ncbi:hypothetical protein PQR71_39865 [Paraburkholderia fungorum]|uniref:hypothetical protein n=1 Tax=Paraburkholderia fungorum TaxID=134537 RepID=UPI0038B9468E
MTEAKLKNVRTSAAQGGEMPAQTVRVAANQVEVTDKNGRRIVVRRLNALEKMRLSKIAGADGAGNPTYFGYVILAASVVSINGEPEEFPMTARAVEALISQLDDDGLAVVSNAVAELGGATNPAEEVEHAKN